MLGALIRGFKKAGVAAEVANLLMKNYNLQADSARLNQYVQTWAELYGNPHELAISYVANQISFMSCSNPAQVRAATKYIRVSKQAYKVGAAVNLWALNELKENAKTTLGIDIDSIEAAPY